MRLTFRRILVPLLVLLAVVPATAGASGRDVLIDCNDNGRLEQSYSQADLADALENIPTDLDEYSNCRDVIRRAQLGGASGGGGNGGSGGGSVGGTGAFGGGGGTTGGTGGGTSALERRSVTQAAIDGASPQERAALNRATAGGGVPVEIGGATIRPGDLGLSSSSSLPTPLLVALVLLGVGAVAGGGLAARHRVLAGRS